MLRVRDREVGMTSEHCDYECIDCILFHAKGRLYKSSCEGDTSTPDPPLVDQASQSTLVSHFIYLCIASVVSLVGDLLLYVRESETRASLLYTQEHDVFTRVMLYYNIEDPDNQGKEKKKARDKEVIITTYLPHTYAPAGRHYR